MQTVVVLAPMQVELQPVVRELGLRRTGGPAAEHTGVVDGVRVLARRAGVGPAPARQATIAAIAQHAPDHVIVTGVAGGIASTLEVGDLVVPEEVVEHGSGATCRPVALGADVAAGRLVTTDGILSPVELAAEIDAGFVAVDMETAAIGLACEAAGVQWTAYRGISDLLREGLVDSSSLQLVRADGTTDPRGVARLLLTRPWLVPRLARLGRDSQRATTVAARAAAAAVRHLAATR